MPTQREVKIAVATPSGDMTYYPAVLHVSPNDTIKWTCESGNMAISFRDRSPIKEGQQMRSTAKDNSILGTVVAKPGIYSYAVAVNVRGSIYLDVGCPEIIVV
jgi:plastocyanin